MINSATRKNKAVSPKSTQMRLAVLFGFAGSSGFGFELSAIRTDQFIDIFRVEPPKLRPICSFPDSPDRKDSVPPSQPSALRSQRPSSLLMPLRRSQPAPLKLPGFLIPLPVLSANPTITSKRVGSPISFCISGSLGRIGYNRQCALLTPTRGSWILNTNGCFRTASSWLAARFSTGRLGDPPLPRPPQSRIRHPKFLAQVIKPRANVNAARRSFQQEAI